MDWSRVEDKEAEEENREFYRKKTLADAANKVFESTKKMIDLLETK